MIPDPSTAGASFVEGGPGQSPTGNDHRFRSRSGHHCAACGQPIEADVWDMVVFASEDTIAYLPCLWAVGA